jgi:hypothetical protein
VIEKYIALGMEHKESLNWSVGVRFGDVSKMICPKCYAYVSIWTNDGLRHTVLGNDMNAMLEKCYDEFVNGKRNNIEPYQLGKSCVKKKNGNWIGKIFK